MRKILFASVVITLFGIFTGCKNTKTPESFYYRIDTLQTVSFSTEIKETVYIEAWIYNHRSDSVLVQNYWNGKSTISIGDEDWLMVCVIPQDRSVSDPPFVVEYHEKNEDLSGKKIFSLYRCKIKNIFKQTRIR